jgi:hypothetical protein
VPQLGLLGARVVPNLGPAVTHVLVAAPRVEEDIEDSQRPVAARHLLGALWASHGGTAGLSALRRALALNSVQFVNARSALPGFVRQAFSRLTHVICQERRF